MKRDEFKGKVNNLSCHLCYPVLNDLHDIDDHDAEQRRVIEQLRKELDLLKQDDAERCTLIRDMEEEEQRKDREIEEARRTAEYWKAEHLAGNTKIEQQVEEIAKLRQSIQTYNMAGLEGIGRSQVLYERIDKQAQQIAALREALQGILEIGKRDMTNPKYDGYFEQAQQALKEVNP